MTQIEGISRAENLSDVVQNECVLVERILKVSSAWNLLALVRVSV